MRIGSVLGSRAVLEEHNQVLTDHGANPLLTQARNAMNRFLYGLEVHLTQFDTLIGGFVLATIQTFRKTKRQFEGQNETFGGTRLLPALFVPPAGPRLRQLAGHTGISLSHGNVSAASSSNHTLSDSATSSTRLIVTESGRINEHLAWLAFPETSDKTDNKRPEMQSGGVDKLVLDLSAVISRQFALQHAASIPPWEPVGSSHAPAFALAELLSTRVRSC